MWDSECAAGDTEQSFSTKSGPAQQAHEECKFYTTATVTMHKVFTGLDTSNNVKVQDAPLNQERENHGATDLRNIFMIYIYLFV